MTPEERKELQKKRYDHDVVEAGVTNITLCRVAARKMSDRQRKEKHRQMEEDRERVRQELREKVLSLNKDSVKSNKSLG